MHTFIYCLGFVENFHLHHQYNEQLQHLSYLVTIQYKNKIPRTTLCLRKAINLYLHTTDFVINLIP